MSRMDTPSSSRPGDFLRKSSTIRAKKPPMSSAHSGPRPNPWRVFALAWVSLTILMGVWAIATPVSASPDEPAHMVKAASVARGQFVGEFSSTGHIVQVPRYVAFTHSQACYAFDSARTADCATEVSGSPGDLVDTSTTAGLYNPLYYALVGWPTLFIDNTGGVFAMRILSGALSSLFLAFSAMMLATWRNPAVPLLAFAASTTPMVLFLGSSVNPNGLEATATLTVFIGILSVILHPNQTLLSQRATIVAAGAFIAMNTRGLSLLWVGLAILMPLLLLSWHDFRNLITRRPIVIAMAGIVFGAALSLAWLLGSNSLGTSTVNAAPGFTYPGTGGSPLYGFTYVLGGTLKFSEGIIGIFGWLDTPAPLGVYFIWAALCGAILLAAFSLLRGRRMIVAGTLIASFLLFPALIQAAFIEDGGLIWQGRYNLPLFQCMIVGLGSLVSASVSRQPRDLISRLSVIVVAALVAGQVYSFATALRRYGVGYTGSWKDLLLNAEWNAPGGNALLITVFALIAVLAAMLLHRSISARLSFQQPASIRARDYLNVE